MSQSTHQIKLRARDETSSAFKSVETSAKMSSSRINKLIGGAVVAASSLVGAKIVSSSISRVAGTINEMARIDEAARLASTSVDDLTGAVAGLGALGLSGINMQSFAKALATMQKTTGRAGLSGFYQTLDALNGIDDAAQRASQTTRAFGDVGISLMPLVNATSEARSSLKILIDTMPSLGSETTSSAAIAKRAIDLFTLEAKYGVMMMLGDLVSSAEDSFNGPSGVAAAAMKAANSIIYAFRMAWLQTRDIWSRFQAGFSLIGGTIGTFAGQIMSGAGIKQALSAAREDFKTTQMAMMDELNTAYYARKSTIQSSYMKRNIDIDRASSELEKLREQLRLSQQVQAKATPQDTDKVPEEDKATTPSREDSIKQQLSNSLVLGGTAEALRLSMLGPQTQNELKKQTKLLEDIKSSTKKTADSTASSSTSQYVELN